jgi:hypothetical protein
MPAPRPASCAVVLHGPVGHDRHGWVSHASVAEESADLIEAFCQNRSPRRVRQQRRYDSHRYDEISSHDSLPDFWSPRTRIATSPRHLFERTLAFRTPFDDLIACEWNQCTAIKPVHNIYLLERHASDCKVGVNKNRPAYPPVAMSELAAFVVGGAIDTR